MFWFCVIPQMTLWCRNQSSARPPFATHPEESISWRGRRGTSTPARSAPAMVAGCCVRPRCAHHCSARAPHALRTPAAPSVQVTSVVAWYRLAGEDAALFDGSVDIRVSSMPNPGTCAGSSGYLLPQSLPLCHPHNTVNMHGPLS